MNMVVIESWKNGLPAKIDHPSLRGGKASDLLASPHGSDPSLFHRQSLDNVEALVDRRNLAVDEDDVGCLGVVALRSCVGDTDHEADRHNGSNGTGMHRFVHVTSSGCFSPFVAFGCLDLRGLRP